MREVKPQREMDNEGSQRGKRKAERQINTEGKSNSLKESERRQVENKLVKMKMGERTKIET